MFPEKHSTYAREGGSKFCFPLNLRRVETDLRTAGDTKMVCPDADHLDGLCHFPINRTVTLDLCSDP